MTHRYPRRVIAADLARGAAGLAVTGGPLAALDVTPVVAVVLGVLAVLFALFIVHVLRRLRFSVETDAEGLTVTARGVRLAWSDLERLALAHYAPRRDSGDGWMELRLGTGDAAVKIDSRIESFTEIVAPAAAAAAARDLALDPATVANLAALGLAAGVSPLEPGGEGRG